MADVKRENAEGGSATTFPFDPDWVIAPGETLKDWFADVGLPYSVASLYAIPPRTLKKLMAGTQPITPLIAQRLCNLTHIGAPFWLALEHNFRVGLAAGKTWTRG
jgi:plasmid maintenance system antidote protein VapI